jgi:CBS domain containing-hemolysin-like protein
MRADVLGAPGRGRRRGSVGEIAHRDFVRVAAHTSLPRVLEALRAARASLALVVESGTPPRGGAVGGIVTKTEIADALLEASEAFQG